MQPARIKRANKSRGLKSLLRLVLANKAARLPAAIVGLAVTAFFVGALLPSGQKAAQSGPMPLNGKASTKSAHTVSVKTAAVKSDAATSTRRRGIDFYTGDVRANMFSEPVAPALPAAPSDVDQRPIPPAPIDPFADWNYTGTATIGDDKIAILENINTHDGILLHLGDKFLGSKVTEIAGNNLTFGTGATQKSLFVSMNTSYIPLSASAGFLTAKAEQPAKPGNALQSAILSLLQGRNGNAAAAAGGPSVTLPNGRVLSGNALTRYNRRLNQGWNTTTPSATGR